MTRHFFSLQLPGNFPRVHRPDHRHNARSVKPEDVGDVTGIIDYGDGDRVVFGSEGTLHVKGILENATVYQNGKGFHISERAAQRTLARARESLL